MSSTRVQQNRIRYHSNRRLSDRDGRRSILIARGIAADRNVDHRCCQTNHIETRVVLASQDNDLGRYGDLADVMRNEPIDFIGVGYAVDNRDAETTILEAAA